MQKRHCASNNLLYCTQTANISKTKLTKILTFSKAPSRRHSFRCRANFSTNYQHNTHTHPFNGPFSGTTQVSRYQKGKTNLDFTGARDSEYPWHQLGHMQVCSSLQTDNHANTSLLSFYRPDAFPATQPAESKH